MANTLTNLIPTAFASLDVVSRELVGFIPSVTRDARTDRVAKNQTLYSPVAPANTLSDITAAMSIPAASDQTIGTKSLTISNYKVTGFSWTGEEQYSLNAQGGPGYNQIMADQVEQCFRAITNQIESDIWTAANAGASRAFGTAGTTPFASDVGASAQMKKILDDNGAPSDTRSLIIDTTAGAALRTLAQLTKANEAGTTMTLRDGELLNLNKFMIKESNAVSTFTIGTGASYLVNNVSGYAIGSTTIAVDTGSGTVLAGDIVTFAGDTNKYVVATALSGGSLVLAAPGLRKTLADNVAMTVTAIATRNIGFSRNALVLASRLPAVPQGGDLAIDRQVVTDARSGISFEMALYPGYRMNKVEISAAWGVSVFKPEHLAILLG